MELEAGQLIGGKYRLFKPLARGGMGAIWVARHVELDVAVAIKVVASDILLSQTAIARFRQEARAAAQLRSPHVVQILDYGIDGSLPFMAMELLSGQDLGQLLESRGRIPLPRALEILAPVCKALKLAHAARIVHRDLKPANIFLARVGDDEVVKVLDFGIAKALNPDAHHGETGSSTLVGSPLYMSPEQSRGDPVDPRTDLWSLAIVAFETLTGDTPFQGRGLGDIFSQVCQGPTPLPSQRGVNISGLDAFFEKALAKEREQRFADAADWISALEECGSGRAARMQRGASPQAVTLDAPIEQVAAAMSAADSSSRTDAAISSEVDKLAASPPPAKSRTAHLVWIAAVIGGALLASLGWVGGLFGGRTTSEATPSSATTDAELGPSHAGVVDVAVSKPPSSSPAAGGESVAVIPTASTLSTAAASVSVAPTASPPISAPARSSAAPLKSQASAATSGAGHRPRTKSSGTSDPVFGISPNQ